MGYKFFRNALIQMLILSFALCIVFYDTFINGKDTGDPRVLIGVGIMAVCGNIFVLYMMLKAKNAEEKGEHIAFQPSESLQNRQKQRKYALLFLFWGGIVFIFGGMKGLQWNFLPLHYLGIIFVGISFLGVLGVNVWRGGPFDPNNDPPE